jgi:ubiquinone/menaquinone biosynthesis C-methylase UbiE
MSYQGAWWLERADREATQRPEHVLDVIGVSEGMTVADVGCGSGYFSVRISKRVGAGGRVLATDLQPEMLALLKKKMAADKALANITPILATDTDVSLPRGSVDIALMVDVYHELAHPQRTVAQIKDALRPQGKLVLVEYRAEDPKVAIKPEHKMTLAQIRAEMDATDFLFVSSDESLPEQRIVTFTPKHEAD